MSQARTSPPFWVLGLTGIAVGLFAFSVQATPVDNTTAEANCTSGGGQVVALEGSCVGGATIHWYRDYDEDTYGVAQTCCCSSTDLDLCASFKPVGWGNLTGDCSDTSSAVNPGRYEICDASNIDNDCDSLTDTLEGVVFYSDLDGDLYGALVGGPYACSEPYHGYVGNHTDCDDNASTGANSNPGHVEVCSSTNTIDNDCDGTNDSSEGEVFYVDTDADLYGSSAGTVQRCNNNDYLGYVANHTDCNDASGSTNPNTLWYYDFDNDGYGGNRFTTRSCTNPTAGSNHFASNNTDCDDASSPVHPGATEVWYDGSDRDCNGLSDYDADLDTYNSSAYGGTDCNDANAAIRPGATEIWYNGVDGNCDGLSDNDADMDGYDSTAYSGTDCNDAVAAVHPGASEIWYDGVDQNCDGLSDNDADADTYNSSAHGGTDCDDTDASVHPGVADPPGDGIDANCDGSVRSLSQVSVGELVITEVMQNPAAVVDNLGEWFEIYNSSTLEIDLQGLQVIDAGTDSFTVTGHLGILSGDYLIFGINSNAVTNGGVTVDYVYTQFFLGNSADRIRMKYGSTVIDDVTYTASWPVPNGQSMSLDPASISVTLNDTGTYWCLGTSRWNSPTSDYGTPGVGNNTASWYRDADADTYGSALLSVQHCYQPSGYVADSTDCNDSAAAARPGGTEICDALDNDCDGTIDENSATDATTWYEDEDGDGYGGQANTQIECYQPSGFVSNTTDCNDDPASVNAVSTHPGATEFCDGHDDNCNGTVDENTASDVRTWYRDADVDSFGTSATLLVQCYQPTGYVLISTDCVDTNAAIYPGALEICNGLDDDCDSLTDDADTVQGQRDWYQDVDADGYGATAVSLHRCYQPSGYVSLSGDCADTNAFRRPGRTEECDGQDNNCAIETSDSDSDGIPNDEEDFDNDGFLTCAQASFVNRSVRNASNTMLVGGSDCDDNTSYIYPASTLTRCDGIESDCNRWSGTTPATSLDPTELDNDVDGYVECAYVLSAWRGSSAVIGGNDCDDASYYRNPGYPEVCDGLDNNCATESSDTDGDNIPESEDDGDNDQYVVCSGFDTSISHGARNSQAELILGGNDCSDSNSNRFTGNTEVCDGQDNDCQALTWFSGGETDADADRYLTCSDASFVDNGVVNAESETLLGGSDCDDARSFFFPGSTDEKCDGVISDCNFWTSSVPPTSTDPTELDGDGDHRVECTIEIAYPWLGDPNVTGGSDCDDANANRLPGNIEVCDGQDNDCNSGTWYSGNETDADGDRRITCAQAAFINNDVINGLGLTILGGSDCDDSDSHQYLGNVEQCDGQDNDCDGLANYPGGENDGDLDQYITCDDASFFDHGNENASSEPILGGSDCDDSAVTGGYVYPGSLEDECDGIQSDCNYWSGTTPAPTSDADEIDNDGDAYVECSISAYGWRGDADVIGGGDVDDNNPYSFPAGDESCDGIDNDNDGFADFVDAFGGMEVDVDGDGFLECQGFVDHGIQLNNVLIVGGGDCDDANFYRNPGRIEDCDGLDNDCSDATWFDEDGEAGESDEDGDRYVDCSALAFLDHNATNSQGLELVGGGDCDDAVAFIYPTSTTEYCDGISSSCGNNWYTNDTPKPAEILGVLYRHEADNDGDTFVDCVVDENIAPWRGNTNVVGGEDCDDTAAHVYPGSVDERCDGISSDCEDWSGGYSYPISSWVAAQATDLPADTYGDEVDDDGDGYVECHYSAVSALWRGYNLASFQGGDDCDDAYYFIYPGSIEEKCDGITSDCRMWTQDTNGDWTAGLSEVVGIANESDDDGDGYIECAPDASGTLFPWRGSTITGGDDCNDSASYVYTGSTEERCDGIISDCDVWGSGPAFVTSGAEVDSDSDGFVECEFYDGTGEPFSWLGVASVHGGGDCDDTRVSVYPGSTEERCDGVSSNCTDWEQSVSGEWTEGLVEDLDQRIYGNETDNDADGWVECAWDSQFLWAGNSRVVGGLDCDDVDPSVHPEADELCDAKDNVCASVDAQGNWPNTPPANEVDADGDFWVPCEGWALDNENPSILGGSDCDDNDEAIYPDSYDERCDGISSDCTDWDGTDPAMASALDPSVYGNEVDNDADGFVECTVTIWRGEVTGTQGGDCNDADATKFPGAIEGCDGTFNDCSRPDYVEAGIPGNEHDDDLDGWVECLDWVGRDASVIGGGDCDDLDASTYPLDPSIDPKAPDYYAPDARELCDGRDNDCTSATQTEDNPPVLIWPNTPPDIEIDNDGDGYVECVLDEEVPWRGPIIAGGSDCQDVAGEDDVSPDQAYLRNPGLNEVCEEVEDGQFDSDCDGNINTDSVPDEGTYVTNPWDWGATYYMDADNDLYGDADAPYELCGPQMGFSTSYGDCDDTNASVGPGQQDGCNGNDDDCDGEVDEPDPKGDQDGCSTLYADRDGDGFGDLDEVLCLCTNTTECDDDPDMESQSYNFVCYVEKYGDCNDDAANIYPEEGTKEKPAGSRELLDGSDNDCTADIPILELDCDDDGSLPILPRAVERNQSIDASTVGLRDCRDFDSKEDQYQTCWGLSLKLTCDDSNGLWTVNTTDAEWRFVDGKRVYKIRMRCDAIGDCDDTCSARCPAGDEVCDGVDNDCNNATDFVVYDTDGKPDAMQDVTKPGYVATEEQDRDGDGYITCLDFVGEDQYDITEASCDLGISENALFGDCNDLCTLTNPAAPEERCNGFLDICEGAVEGEDRDRDEFESCGPWAVDPEAQEDLYLVAFYAGALVEIDTSFWETAESGQVIDTDDSGADSGKDTGVKKKSPQAVRTSFPRPLPITEDPVHDIVPLLLPRPNAPDCDAYLTERLGGYLGEDVVTNASLAGSVEPLLRLCIKADTCKAIAEGKVKVEGGLRTAWPADCEGMENSSDTEIGCTILRIPLVQGLDEVGDRMDWLPGCPDHPEQYVTRTVWSAERILQARALVREWECYRLYGTYGCGEFPAPDGWRSPYGTTGVIKAGGYFPNQRLEQRIPFNDVRWWMELNRFSPSDPTTGALLGCWGDPTDQDVPMVEATGGDCNDQEGIANRDGAEGPGDLVGIFNGTPAECSTCLDGLDNNCNGLLDCAEPACAACFMGQGVGCGGGSGSPCAQYGCAANTRTPNRRDLGTALALVLLSLVSIGYRWRR